MGFKLDSLIQKLLMWSLIRYIQCIYIYLLEWTTSLDTSSRTLFVREGGRERERGGERGREGGRKEGREGGSPRHVERRFR